MIQQEDRMVFEDDFTVNASELSHVLGVFSSEMRARALKNIWTKSRFKQQLIDFDKNSEDSKTEQAKWTAVRENLSKRNLYTQLISLKSETTTVDSQDKLTELLVRTTQLLFGAVRPRAILSSICDAGMCCRVVSMTTKETLDELLSHIEQTENERDVKEEEVIVRDNKKRRLCDSIDTKKIEFPTLEQDPLTLNFQTELRLLEFCRSDLLRLQNAELQVAIDETIFNLRAIGWVKSDAFKCFGKNCETICIEAYNSTHKKGLKINSTDKMYRKIMGSTTSNNLKWSLQGKIDGISKDGRLVEIKSRTTSRGLYQELCRLERP